MAAPCSLIFIAFLVSLSLGIASSSRVILQAAENNITLSYFNHTDMNNITTATNITNSQSDQALCDQPGDPGCIEPPNPCCNINRPYCCPPDDLYCCSPNSVLNDPSPADETCCNLPSCLTPPPPCCGCDVPIGTGTDMPIIHAHVVRPPKYSSASSEPLINATAH